MADRLNRRDFGLGIGATGALVMATGRRRAQAQTPPLKLGVLAPRSGFEALIGQGCQRGFAAWREVSWSDISRGMGSLQPSSQDELQMRAFWRRWHALMQGLRGPTDCSDRPEQREAAE